MTQTPGQRSATTAVDRIGDAVDGRCACGCGTRLREDGSSAWFATEACQLRWQSAHGKPLSLPVPTPRPPSTQLPVAVRYERAQPAGPALSTRPPFTWGVVPAQLWVGILAYRRECHGCGEWATPTLGLVHALDVPSIWQFDASDVTVVAAPKTGHICPRCRHPFPAPSLYGNIHHVREQRVWEFHLDDGQGGAVIGVTEEMLAYGPDARVVADHVWRKLQHGLAEERLPGCAVSGCTDKGRVVFKAAESGRLAGREWRPGDDIRLCPRHGSDVRYAQYAYGLDQMAEWLRPDANLNPIDAWDAGSDTLYSEAIQYSRGHALRVTLPMP